MTKKEIKQIRLLADALNEILSEIEELRKSPQFHVYLNANQKKKIMCYLDDKGIVNLYNKNNKLKDSIQSWLQDIINERIDLL